MKTTIRDVRLRWGAFSLALAASIAASLFAHVFSGGAASFLIPCSALVLALTSLPALGTISARRAMMILMLTGAVWLAIAGAGIIFSCDPAFRFPLLLLEALPFSAILVLFFPFAAIGIVATVFVAAFASRRWETSPRCIPFTILAALAIIACVPALDTLAVAQGWHGPSGACVI